MDKPTLTLIKGQKLTAGQAADLYFKLTGREPTADEMDQLRTRLPSGREPYVIDLNALEAGQPHWLSKPKKPPM